MCHTTGLRALLRFMTGFYVCLNRGDIGKKEPKVLLLIEKKYFLLSLEKKAVFTMLTPHTRSGQNCTEAAGRSLVSIIVDHIFVCIKDSGNLSSHGFLLSKSGDQMTIKDSGLLVIILYYYLLHGNYDLEFQ